MFDVLSAAEVGEGLVSSGMTLEVLNCALAGFGLLARRESSKVATLARPGILFSRVKAVFS